jgi:hypothetical protein
VPIIGLAFAYDPPLPMLSAPLHSGVRRFSTAVRMTRLSDGQTMATGEIEDVTWVVRVAGADPEQFEIHRVRTMTMGSRTTPPGTLLTRVQPGVGAISSEESVEGEPPARTKQICAIIGGRQVGTCPSAAH